MAQHTDSSAVSRLLRAAIVAGAAATSLLAAYSAGAATQEQAQSVECPADSVALLLLDVPQPAYTDRRAYCLPAAETLSSVIGWLD